MSLGEEKEKPAHFLFSLSTQNCKYVTFHEYIKYIQMTLLLCQNFGDFKVILAVAFDVSALMICAEVLKQYQHHQHS